MRAIWKGAITFGLVNVPIKLYSATESHDVSLHQVHARDGGRIRYQRRCEVCGEAVKWEEIDKAYDAGDQTVVLTSEDLDALPVERSREITVMQFVPSDQLDPIILDKSYYLGPDSRSTKSYQLLRRTLEETDRTAIVTFTLRQKTRLGALRVYDDVLVLQAMLWPDEVRQAEFPELEDEVKIGSAELKMSKTLVENYSEDFDPAAFHDEYTDELNKLIDAKLEQGAAVDTEATFGKAEAPEEDNVLDLMEALRRSVEESRKGRKGAAAAEDEEDDVEEPAAAAGGSTSGGRSSSRSGSSSSGSSRSGSSSKSATKPSTSKSSKSASPSKSTSSSKSTSTKSSSSRATAKKDDADKPAAKRSTTTRKTTKKSA